MLGRAAAAHARHQRRRQRIDPIRLPERRLALVDRLVVPALERGDPVHAAVLVDGERTPLGGLHRGRQLAVRLPHEHLAHLARVERQGAARLGLAGLHRRADREVHDALAIESRGERLAHATDRVLELGPLALHLADLRVELVRHAVELNAQRRELVVAVHRDRLGEVALAETSRGLEELTHLALQRPDDDNARQEREDQERGEDAADQKAAVGDRAADGRAVVEEADTRRRAGGVGHVAEARAVLVAGELHVAVLPCGGCAGTRDRLREDAARLEHADLEAGHAADLLGELGRVRGRDHDEAEAAALGRRRRGGGEGDRPL